MSADIPNRKPKTARHHAAAVVSMLLVAAGCSQPTQKTPVKVVPTSSTQAAELPTATLENGFVVNLDLAITQEEVANGLMFRPSLPTDRGMLFIFDVERQPSFWMKNTLIPLDLFFLDSLGKVVDIVADAQPCAAEESLYLPLHRMITETIFLHWYWCGRIYASLTQNQRMLDKIS